MTPFSLRPSLKWSLLPLVALVLAAGRPQSRQRRRRRPRLDPPVWQLK